MVLEYVPVGKEETFIPFLVEIGIPVFAKDKEEALKIAWERYEKGEMDTLPPRVISIKKLERVV